MTRICFIDTETTSLRFDRRAWEIGIIAREPGKPDVEHHWFIDADDLDLGNADLFSLNVGKFFERHPQARLDREHDYTEVQDEGDALREVEAITRGAHLIGAVVSFDAEVLGNRMREHGICPTWHYHVCCVENLVTGWLNATAAYYENREVMLEHAAWLRQVAQPPWDSAELSKAVDLNPGLFDRHTALGDAQWAAALWDAVTGRTP